MAFMSYIWAQTYYLREFYENESQIELFCGYRKERKFKLVVDMNKLIGQFGHKNIEILLFCTVHDAVIKTFW